MKFKIDTRYIAILTLKSLAATLLGIFIVLLFIRPQDQVGFAGAALAAAAMVYFLTMYPGSILVNNGILCFTQKYGMDRKREVALSNIAKIETSSNLYNTLTITTHSGETYTLYPADPQSLIDSLR